jgi:Fic family protein
MSPYIYELADWPRFHWDSVALAAPLGALRHRQGRLLGRMENLGFSLRAEATLQALTTEIIKSSEIEGENLNRDSVRSSVARRLGIDIGALAPADRNVEGVVEMTLDATQNYRAPLTLARLFGWHAALFPTGYSGMRQIAVGRWRNDSRGPMQVVSGPIGQERVHFEAPPATRLDQEIAAFLQWFETEDSTDLVLRAGLAHLWFVTVHPFDDGNGRIARAIADMALARSDQSAQRFYSMSAQIRIERNAYYDRLEKSQAGGLDITPWLEWFLGCLDRAIEQSEQALGSVLRKARFWETHAHKPFNDRQRLMLNKLLDGFEGKMTSSKWAQLARCSQDTALRDILQLIDQGSLAKDPGGGRSTSYSLVEPEPTKTQ